MRILLVTETPPAGDEATITGGVEARNHYLLRHLGPEHEVVLSTRSSAGGPRVSASPLAVLRRLVSLVAGVIRAARQPFDIAEGSNLVVYPFAWLAAKLRRRAVVFWYPDVLLGTWRSGAFGRAGVLGELVERVVLRLPVDGYLAISQTTADKLVAHGIAAEQIRVVPCGYEPALVAGARRAPRPDATRSIAVVSRLVSYKRVDVAIRAFGLLAKERPDLRLDIVGQGPERPALEALAASLAVDDRVTFHGFVAEHTDVLEIIGRADVFVSASEVEGFGIVVVEAMALGVPYVVADTTVFREVTGGGTGGALFPPGDEHALARAAGELLDDDQHHTTSRKAGEDFAERYTWAAVTEQTVEAYEWVLGRRLSRRRSR